MYILYKDLGANKHVCFEWLRSFSLYLDGLVLDEHAWHIRRHAVTSYYCKAAMLFFSFLHVPLLARL